MSSNHSPVLFVNEIGESFMFVIKPCKDKEKLREMIEYGGGEVVSTPGAHGVTLVPPDVGIEFNDEVFSTDYIKACCTRNKILDIKPYRLNADPRFPEGFDVMNVLLKHTSWSDALKGLPAKKTLFVGKKPLSSDSSSFDEFDECDYCDCVERNIMVLELSGDKCEIKPLWKDCPSDELNNARLHISHADNPSLNKASGSGVLKKGQRSSGSEKQSSPDKASSETSAGKCHSKDDTDMKTSQDKQRREEVAKLSKEAECKMKDKNENLTSGSSKQGLNIHRRCTRKSRAPRKDVSSGSEVESSDDDALWKEPIKIAKKPWRKEYTDKERRTIISYVTKSRYHDFVKGREIWQTAEARQICPGRTWQSMKEHYVKKIIPNIKAYNLSEEEVRKLRKPFH